MAENSGYHMCVDTVRQEKDYRAWLFKAGLNINNPGLVRNLNSDMRA